MDGFWRLADQIQDALAPSEPDAPDAAAIARQYLDDSLGWIDAFVDFGPDGALAPYQRDLIAAVPRYGRVCGRGPRGLGKTSVEALITLWFAWTREAAGIDWKAPTTAGVWRQLQHFLWPEIHKWARRLRWEQLGTPPWREGRELLDLAIRLRHGEAFAVASDQPALIEGAHADHLLFVYDEAKSIAAGVFDSAEGAFANAGPETGHVAYALACSTPGDVSGRFYEIQSRAAGTEDWWVRSVTLTETIAAGRVSLTWAEARRRQWGADSPLYINHVLGDFAGSPPDAVIALAWVEAAIERWHAWAAAGRPGGDQITHVGADIGAGGDATILAIRHEAVVGELRRGSGDTMDTAGRLHGLLEAGAKRVVVDVVGVGTGVIDQLRQLGHRARVIAYNGAAGVDGKRRDRSGELGFVNTRSAAYWSLRELLQPDNPDPIALPPDDELIRDLTAPKWRVHSGGRVQVEPKDDVVARLGRSPDKGDAVAMAYWAPDLSNASLLLHGGVSGWSPR